MKKQNDTSKKKAQPSKEEVENSWNVGNYGSRNASEKALSKKEKPSKK